MARVVGERHVQCYNICACECLIWAGCELDFQLVGPSLGEEGVVSDNLHAKGLSTLGKLCSDASHANDGEALFIELNSGIGLAGSFEVTFEDFSVGRADVARSRKHESESQLSGGDGITCRRVHDDDTVVGG